MAGSTSQLSKILTQLMQECDLDDASLARQTGVPASTISRLKLSANANPTANNLRPLAKYFDISISQLLGDEPLPVDRLPGTHHHVEFTSSRLPVLNWEMLPSCVTEGASSIESKSIYWVSTEKNVSTTGYAVIVPTDSFGLAFRKGSLLIVDPEIKPKDGDLALIQHGDSEITIKQFLFDADDVYIRSVNPELKEIKRLEQTYKCYGTVVETRYAYQDHTRTSYEEYKKQYPAKNFLLTEA